MLESSFTIVICLKYRSQVVKVREGLANLEPVVLVNLRVAKWVNILLCSALWVKQRWLSKDFIAINDKQKRLPWVCDVCDGRGGKESSLMERQRERVSSSSVVLPSDLHCYVKRRFSGPFAPPCYPCFLIPSGRVRVRSELSPGSRGESGGSCKDCCWIFF